MEINQHVAKLEAIVRRLTEYAEATWYAGPEHAFVAIQRAKELLNQLDQDAEARGEA